MAYNLPPAWDAGFALPDNVEDEGLERRAFISKMMPRGTYDDSTDGTGGYVVPQQVLDEGIGQGTFTTQWQPSGTYNGPKVPHWLNNRPQVVRQKRLASGGTMSTIAMGDDQPLPKQFEDYGTKAAQILIGRVSGLPTGQRQATLKAILDAVDPSLWARTNTIWNRYRSQGMAPATAFPLALARAMSAGIAAEIVNTGLKGAAPQASSLLGLGCYGCLPALGAINLHKGGVVSNPGAGQAGSASPGGSLIGSIVGGIKSVAGGITSVATAVGSGITSAAGTVAGAAGSAAGTVAGATGTVASTAGGVLTTVVDTTGSVIGGAAGGIATAATTVGSGISDAAGTVVDAAGSVVNTIVSVPSSIVNAAGQVVNWTVDAAGAVYDAGGTVIGWVKDASGAIYDAGGKLIGWIVTAAKAVGGAVMTGLNDLGDLACTLLNTPGIAQAAGAAGAAAGGIPPQVGAQAGTAGAAIAKGACGTAPPPVVVPHANNILPLAILAGGGLLALILFATKKKRAPSP